MVTLTHKAADKIKHILAEEKDPAYHLRIGVKGGGCSGLSYFLTLDKQQRPDDKVIEQDGITLVLDSKSALYLEGTELDYTESLMGSGFVFNNPNAVRTCGCGESFSM